LWIATFCLLGLLVGCDDGAQHGKYVVSGSSSRALDGPTGELTIVHGYVNPPTQSPHQQPLIYALVLAPGATASGSGSGSSSNDGTYVSTMTWKWGNVRVEFSWDRRSDTVAVGGSSFDRARGNAFVIVRERDGNLSVTQLGPLNAGLDPFAALPQIQAMLPADSPAKSVQLKNSGR
jgi:hypothetical protein